MGEGNGKEQLSAVEGDLTKKPACDCHHVLVDLNTISVARLGLQPNEILVVQIPLDMSTDRCQEIAQAFSAAFKASGFNNRAIFLPREVDLTIMTKDDIHELVDKL